MRKSIYFVFAVALIITTANAFAQSTVVVMKAMDGATKLNGGSTVAGHSNEIDILSDSQGESRCDGCGVPSLADFNVMITLSAATIALKKKTLNGTPLASIDVAFIKQGTTPFLYYRIHMENVFVTSVQESASSEAPIFAVSFAPARIAWQHVKQNSDGSQGTRTTYGWDVALNAAWSYVFP
jgi:type VI protein secretion system component Hcp